MSDQHRDARSVTPSPRTGTVAALATAPGRSAIASVLVHGPEAIRAVAKFCRIEEAALRYRRDGQFHIASWNGSAGERVVVHVHCHDTVEIHCHGGLVPSRTILADLATLGIARVSWHEIGRRGAQSIIEHEALEALTQATTVRTASILLDQYNGSLVRRLNCVLKLLADGKADEAAVDLGRLLDWAELGRHLVCPWRVAIVGRPNAGKSSLLNAMLGYNRAIVHATPGTTRDLVSGTTAVDGWPVEFLDTAGIHVSGDKLESAGIDRSLGILADSDRQIFVCDISQPFTAEDHSLLRSCSHPSLVASKSDLPAVWRLDDQSERVISTSARTGDGVAELLAQLGRSLVPRSPEPGEGLAFTDRQLNHLRQALEHLQQTSDPIAAMNCVRCCMEARGIERGSRPAKPMPR
jgi:tRNA modification GTPase